MSRLIRKYKNREGLTLLEVGIVLAVFALIIIGVLTAVSVVNASGRNSRAVTQIGNIRSAIGKWSAGGPVAMAAIKNAGGTVTLVSSSGLVGWDALVGYLPGSLATVINATPGISMNLTLANANPWQGSYELCTPANTCGAKSTTISAGDTFKYGIRATQVNPGELPTVVNQLRVAGTGDTVVEQIGTTEFVVVYSN